MVPYHGLSVELCYWQFSSWIVVINKSPLTECFLPPWPFCLWASWTSTNKSGEIVWFTSTGHIIGLTTKTLWFRGCSLVGLQIYLKHGPILRGSFIYHILNIQMWHRLPTIEKGIVYITLHGTETFLQLRGDVLVSWWPLYPQELYLDSKSLKFFHVYVLPFISRVEKLFLERTI